MQHSSSVQCSETVQQCHHTMVLAVDAAACKPAVSPAPFLSYFLVYVIWYTTETVLSNFKIACNYVVGSTASTSL